LGAAEIRAGRSNGIQFGADCLKPSKQSAGLVADNGIARKLLRKPRGLPNAVTKLDQHLSSLCAILHVPARHLALILPRVLPMNARTACRLMAT
jgi:hypothetical protein